MVRNAIGVTLLLAASACSQFAGPETAPTATVFLITATLPATLTPEPSRTAAPPTPLPTSAPVRGITTTALNVRAGASITAASLGTVGIFSNVTIAGRDPSGSWFQITYAGGKDGRGWVNASYVQVEGSPEIAVISSEGAIVAAATIPANAPGTAVVSGPLPASTEAIGVAPLDGDSAGSPAADVSFSPAGARSLQYTSDVSSPGGDTDDWIRFKPYGAVGEAAAIEVILDCEGGPGMRLELAQSGAILQTWDNVTCSERRRLLLSLFGGPAYLLHIVSAGVSGTPAYIRYTVMVQGSQ